MDVTGFDFADFGCSSGSSMEWARRRLGGERGLGIDIDPKKVERARQAGLDAELGDCAALEVPDRAFRFVVMSHFLEHLPNLQLAEKCIKTAMRCSREFVMIRQPWFSSDGALAEQGLKLFWSDWHGHPNKMDSLDFVVCLRKMKWRWRWVLLGSKPIIHADHTALIPLHSDRNSSHYDKAIHGQKNRPDSLPSGVYEEAVCILYHETIDPQPLKDAIHQHTVLLTSQDFVSADQNDD